MPQKQDGVATMRVLIYDRCPLFAHALEKLINGLDGFSVEFVTYDIGKVTSAIAEKNITFVILDLDSGMPCVQLLEQIKRLWLPVRCVMTITDGRQPQLMAAIRMQADGFLTKLSTAQQFAQQIPLIACGEMVISDALTNALATTLRNVPYPDESRDIGRLSPREVEVLQCIAEGMSNRQISERLGISDGTVKVHVKHVLKKLDFSTRVEAALWASENGHRSKSWVNS